MNGQRKFSLAILCFVLILLFDLGDMYAQVESAGLRSTAGLLQWSLPGLLIEKPPVVFFNPPAGPPLTSADLDYQGSTLVQFNQFGSFGYFNNGMEGTFKTSSYHTLVKYNYLNYDGNRQHNSGYGHTAVVGMAAIPSKNTSLEIIGYYAKGQINLPGSLTQAEFDNDPYQADPRSIHRDQKRRATTGALDINYSASFGKSMNNRIQIKTHGEVDYMERTTEEYKIINKIVLGVEASFKNNSHLWNHKNELSLGGSLFTRPKSTEYYENLSGERSDQMEQLKNENAPTSALYLYDNFEIVRNKLFIQFDGRFDREVFTISEATLPSRSDEKIFQAFTPRVALDYTVWRWLTFFTSYGLGFRIPTEKELEDSPDPAYLYNQDLRAQKSNDFEMGFKGDLVHDSAVFLQRFHAEASFFASSVDNLIVPYEAYLENYFRNASISERMGCKFKCQVEIINYLDLTFGYTYSHFIYKSNNVETLETDTIVNRDFSGNTEPGIPESLLLVAVSYDRPIGKRLNVVGKMSYTGRSGLWVDDANSSKTGRADLVNMLLGINMRFGHFDLLVSAGVNNMFNMLYVGYVTVNSMDQRFYNPGAPRDYFGSLNFIYTL